ncbi:hypothetical protein [Collimonas fungivorans]|uniref:hypothetical protein n=1 Tax=Collimonas fungivorans TaxID=158899 RepID=UPI003FA34963
MLLWATVFPLSERDWSGAAPVQDAIDERGFGRAVYSFGSNSRASSARARKELGWQPQHRSVLDWIRNEMRED